MKYRQKPVFVEAFQFTGFPMTNYAPIWLVDAALNGLVKANGPVLVIRTPCGDEIRVEHGSWIIRHANGLLSGCNAKTFKETYDEERECKPEPSVSFGAR